MSDTKIVQTDRRLATLALIVALGVALHRIEAFLPLPAPWIKLGLANVMTLVALVFFGFRDALMVTLLRVILGSFLGGTFLSPTFFFEPGRRGCSNYNYGLDLRARQRTIQPHRRQCLRRVHSHVRSDLLRVFLLDPAGSIVKTPACIFHICPHYRCLHGDRR